MTRHAVAEFPTANGPADYALFVDGRWLGIIEAKKVGTGPQNVLEQARRYSRGAAPGAGDWCGLKVPFLYATNGEVVWHVDERLPDALSSQVSQLPGPTELAARFASDPAAAIARLQATPPGQVARLRDYQDRCIRAVEGRLAVSQREMLVAMATGTGKTFLTVAQIHRLLEAKFARRVLFLVDRKALAAQAVREFSAFTTPSGFKFTQEYEVFSQRFQREDFGDDEPFDPKVLPPEYLTAPSPVHTYVYVCTIQRMARYLFGAQGGFAQSGDDAERDDESDRLDIPRHVFDVIIADECHRGYSADELGVWRATLDHFSATKIGLTATPAAHTVALFGHPVFRYGIEEAVRDGYLCDWDAVAIRSDVRLNGVFLREGETVANVDTDTGAQQLDLIEDERAFAAPEVERSVTAPQSNQGILEEIARYGRVAIADRDCVLTPQTTYYRLAPEVFVGGFLMLYLASQPFSEQVDVVKEQTTRDFVPITEQYSLFHRVPPLPEQQEIVRRVEALFALADKIEARYAKAQAQVDRLTPSLLARAFAGKLVPQDPADEPAAVLLERIRARNGPATSAAPNKIISYPEAEPRELKVAEPGRRARRKRKARETNG